MQLAFLGISLKIESAFGNARSVEKITFAPFEFVQVQLGLDLTAKGLIKVMHSTTFGTWTGLGSKATWAHCQGDMFHPVGSRHFFYHWKGRLP